MKLIIDPRNIKAGLAHVSRAISSRGPLPILTHVYLEATEGVLTFRATDLEVGIESRMPAAVDSNGAIALPFKTLSDIAAKLPPGDVELILDPATARVMVRSGRSKFNVAAMGAQDFPQLPVVTGASIELPREAFLSAVRQVLPCAAGEDKAVISGVHLELADGVLNVVATDGYRLGRRSVDRPGSEAIALIIPARAVGEIERHLKTLDSQSVTLTASSNQIHIAMGDRLLTARLVDGTYPPYRQIIPNAFEREAVLDRAAFMAAVDRASIMAFDREAHTVKLEFGNGELHITAGESERGDSSETLSIQYTGEPLTVSYNADYLTDALKACEGECVRVGLNGPLAPAILNGTEDTAHIALLMPMNRV
jgi:DNA polymerase-3 subunit beta